MFSYRPNTGFPVKQAEKAAGRYGYFHSTASRLKVTYLYFSPCYALGNSVP